MCHNLRDISVPDLPLAHTNRVELIDVKYAGPSVLARHGITNDLGKEYERKLKIYCHLRDNWGGTQPLR